jgi:hypothetical protein
VPRRRARVIAVDGRAASATADRRAHDHRIAPIRRLLSVIVVWPRTLPEGASRLFRKPMGVNDLYESLPGNCFFQVEADGAGPRDAPALPLRPSHGADVRRLDPALREVLRGRGIRGMGAEEAERWWSDLAARGEEADQTDPKRRSPVIL